MPHLPKELEMVDDMTTRHPQVADAPSARDRSRGALLAAVAFVVCFIGSVIVSSVPADNASNAAWVAAYTGRSNQIGHVATGVLLMLAGLSLMTLLTAVWRENAARRPAGWFSPLPLIAAGAAAACMAAGGVVMGAISGAAIVGSAPLPSAELLRFGDDLGFALVAVGGMPAAALSVAVIGLQARATGMFGRRLTWFSLIVAVLLLAAVAFVPIAALLAWTLTVATVLHRQSHRPAGFIASPEAT